MRVHKIRHVTMYDHFLPKVIARTDCKKHDAEQGQPCWEIVLDEIPVQFSFGTIATNPALPAVCGERTIRAGFVGEVSPHSLQLRRRHDGN